MPDDLKLNTIYICWLNVFDNQFIRYKDLHL